MIEALRKAVDQEVFDYQTLLTVLSGYARPRDKITEMLRRQEIVRVKKGLYLFGEHHRHKPYSRELLANLIYGPSYLSLDYALSYYGLIPERVEVLTSIAQGRARRFETPVGLFTYRCVSMSGFQGGVQRLELEGGGGFLMATPEKALAEKVRAERGAGLTTQHDLEIFLFDNLRINPEALRSMAIEQLRDIGQRYHSQRIQVLSRWMQRFQKRKGDSHA